MEEPFGRLLIFSAIVKFIFNPFHSLDPSTSFSFFSHLSYLSGPFPLSSDRIYDGGSTGANHGLALHHARTSGTPLYSYLSLLLHDTCPEEGKLKFKASWGRSHRVIGSEIRAHSSLLLSLSLFPSFSPSLLLSLSLSLTLFLSLYTYLCWFYLSLSLFPSPSLLLSLSLFLTLSLYIYLCWIYLSILISHILWLSFNNSFFSLISLSTRQEIFCYCEGRRWWSFLFLLISQNQKRRHAG